MYKTRHYTDEQDKTNPCEELWMIYKNGREFYDQCMMSSAIEAVKECTNEFQNAIGGLVYGEMW